VEKTHVNLADLVDRPNNIKVFATEVALSISPYAALWINPMLNL
jgi:hypothetical protein